MARKPLKKLTLRVPGSAAAGPSREPAVPASSEITTSVREPRRARMARVLLEMTRAIRVTSSSSGTSLMGVSSPRLR